MTAETALMKQVQSWFQFRRYVWLDWRTKLFEVPIVVKSDPSIRGVVVRYNTGGVKRQDAHGKERHIRFGVGGHPDLMVYKREKIPHQDATTQALVAIGVELKGPTTRTTELQKQFHEVLALLGGQRSILVARSIEDLEASELF